MTRQASEVLVAYGAYNTIFSKGVSSIFLKLHYQKFLDPHSIHPELL